MLLLATGVLGAVSSGRSIQLLDSQFSLLSAFRNISFSPSSCFDVFSSGVIDVLASEASLTRSISRTFLHSPIVKTARYERRMIRLN